MKLKTIWYSAKIKLGLEFSSDEEQSRNIISNFLDNASQTTEPVEVVTFTQDDFNIDPTKAGFSHNDLKPTGKKIYDYLLTHGFKTEVILTEMKSPFDFSVKVLAST